jgi:hypothetical protein
MDFAKILRRQARAFHPRTYRATAAHPRNGAKKPTRPTTIAFLNYFRITSGSRSAPATNVCRTAPAPARNLSHSELVPGMSNLPKRVATAATPTPTHISTRAMTEFPYFQNTIQAILGHKKTRYAAGCRSKVRPHRRKSLRGRSHQPGPGGYGGLPPLRTLKMYHPIRKRHVQSSSHRAAECSQFLL